MLQPGLVRLNAHARDPERAGRSSPGGTKMISDASIDRICELTCRKMPSLSALRDVVARDLRALVRDVVDVRAGRSIVLETQRCPQLYLVETGWVFRSRSMAGGQRQIVNYALPGDFLCVDSVLFKSSSFDLFARTNVTLYRIDAPATPDMFERHPGLAAAVSWTAGQDESVLAERVVSLGRRDSLAKLAHQLCELIERLSVIGLMPGNIIETPLNQEDFADILGISVIHVNRTFRRLHEENIAEYRKGQIEILDRRRLAEIAGFDAAYLHLH